MEYNLGMNDQILQQKVIDVLKDKVNPILEGHFGSADLSSIENGIVYVRMNGACSSCPSAQYTVEDIVKAEIMNELPDIVDVVLDSAVSEDVLEMARKILNKEV